MRMTQTTEPAGVAAVVYDESMDVDAIFAEVVAMLRRDGVTVGGLLQRFGEHLPNGKRSMTLENLATGAIIRLDRPRGPGATACILDPDALARAACVLRRATESPPDLIVVNRFGHAEAEGRGMRTEIAGAIGSGALVLIAVRYSLLMDWAGFLGTPPNLLLPAATAIAAWVHDHLPESLPEAGFPSSWMDAAEN